MWAYFSDVNNKSINLSELLTLGIVKEVDGDSEDLAVDKSFKSQHNTKKYQSFSVDYSISRLFLSILGLLCLWSNTEMILQTQPLDATNIHSVGDGLDTV